MKKLLSIVLAVCMLFSVTSYAFASTGEETELEPDFDNRGSVTDNHSVRNAYGTLIGEVLVTVYYTYNGQSATITHVDDDSSYCNQDWRMTGAATYSGDTVTVDFTFVPLGSGNSFRVYNRFKINGMGNKVTVG